MGFETGQGGTSGSPSVVGVPTGMIMIWPFTGAPVTYLPCDGSAVSRVTFAALFAVIGTTWGEGDGVTTFNLPSTEGLFPRGVSGASGNDPDAASRTALFPGGNTGNNVGSYQSDAFGSHTHLQDAHTHTQDAHNHTQDAHTHTQNSHNHTQDAHTHTQNSHNHTQDTHGHSARIADIDGNDLFDTNTEAWARRTAGGVNYGYDTGGAISGNTRVIVNATATNQAATATNQNTTATNQAATATNQNTTATNQATTATNQNTTATNQNSGGNETRPKNFYINFVIKT